MTKEEQIKADKQVAFLESLNVFLISHGIVNVSALIGDDDSSITFETAEHDEYTIFGDEHGVPVECIPERIAFVSENG